ncbi:MAG: 16S rRNA processing protein RimM [Acidobacteria bacterium]|nr:MAG: 16S rRNA processing protein RimM [Acidobacteriota bacterium]
MPAFGEFIVVARVMRPQGRRGEVLAEILTDFPERFAERKQLWLGQEDEQERREYSLVNHWFHKDRVVFKFAGVDSISDAERLKGSLVQIPLESRAELPAGTIYVRDLIGSVLIEVLSESEIGRIEDVRQGIGAAPLLVVRSLGGEYEIPFAEEYVVRFNRVQKVLKMKLPAGLLEVNAPLSAEEKEHK